VTNVVVFVGPTLAAERASGILRADFLPPARQGDVYRALRDREPKIIGLIDGAFLHAPAVWHREILHAMSEGVHVYGAASMGALRAAELRQFGMRGVGAIYKAYCSGVYAPYPPPFERDEEVAVVHGPAELGYAPLSEALVDMRASFAAAASAGAIDEETRDRLLAIARELHFVDRTYDATIEKARAQKVDCQTFEAWAKSGKVSQKADDARAMLAEIARFANSKVEPFRAPFEFEHSLAWERFCETCDYEDRRRLAEADDDIVDELRLDPALFALVFENARLREAALAKRRDKRAESKAQDERRGLESLRARHGLARRADIDDFMRRNALDDASMRRLARAEGGLAALDPPSPRALIDCARAMGFVARVSPRAIDKRGVLDRLPDAQRTLDALERASLTASFLEGAQGGLGGESLEAIVGRLALQDENALVKLLWRERLYKRAKGGDS